MAVQVAALSAALLGALFLTWTEKRWPEHPGSDHRHGIRPGSNTERAAAGQQSAWRRVLKDMLVGQILWVGHMQIAVVAVLTAIVLAAWFGIGRQRLGRVGFYLLFGLSVTASVQMVGVYLVFSSLIIPALASRNATRFRLTKAYAVGGLGYLLGLVASTLFDWPTGAIIVWAMALVGIVFSSLERGTPKPAT